jgi:phage-related protein
MDIAEIKLADSPNGFSLYAIAPNNQCFIKHFIEELDINSKKQIIALFNLILVDGPPKNEEKFKSVGDHILELKTRSGVRILSFYAGPQFRNTLILTHGFKKPHPNRFKREKQKAVDWYMEYNSSETRVISVEEANDEN